MTDNKHMDARAEHLIPDGRLKECDGGFIGCLGCSPSSPPADGAALNPSDIMIPATAAYRSPVKKKDDASPAHISSPTGRALLRDFLGR